MAGVVHENAMTVEEVFKDFEGRRTGLIKALTTDVRKFYGQCDPEEGDLCLFGLPNGKWEIKPPEENVPTVLPEPVLGINKARERMQENYWLSFIAMHSDAWLLSMASFMSYKFHQPNRRRLFDMINDLPTIYEVLKETAMKQAKEKSSVPNLSLSLNISEYSSKAGSEPQAKDGDKDDSEEEDDEVCWACGKQNIYDEFSFWICCDYCSKWFHGVCVNITEAKAQLLKKYKCWPCTQLQEGARP